jgi:hypothetical protein
MATQFTSADLDRFAVDLMDRLRPHFAAIAAAAYDEAIAGAPRTYWRTGLVEALKLDRVPPEVEVRVSGEQGTTWAQCMVATPLIGQHVGVMYVPPSGALAWPVAEAAPYRDVLPTLSSGATTTVPMDPLWTSRARLIDSHTVHYAGAVLTTGAALPGDRLFIALPVPARFDLEVANATGIGQTVGQIGVAGVSGTVESMAQLASAGLASSAANNLAVGNFVAVSWSFLYEVAPDFDHM